jgi:uncharacterized repeat protein (TIGR03803 family)
MKTKLLLTISFLLITATLSAQQQMWAITEGGGTTSGGTIIRMNADGSGFSVAHNYACSMTSGCMPMGNLLYASDGNFYGTCFLGGQYASCTVDKFNPATGTYTDIYDFDITNGDFPRSGLVEAPNGKLYGVASSGGTSWAGVLYSLTLSGYAYVVEHSFTSATGMTPWGCPLLKNNVLYGLTTSGGSGGTGVIYSYDIATSVYSVLYNFTSVTGDDPRNSLIEAANGLFYGLTYSGGANNMGTIFSFNPANNAFTLLHSFSGANGSSPAGALMQATNGKLYGVTSMGGTNNAGVLFSYDISQSSYTKHYDFFGDTGKFPQGNLYQAPNGLLYGTTKNGGPLDKGALFTFDISTNAYTTILNFVGSNGANPTGGFILADLPVGMIPVSEESFAVYPNPVAFEIYFTFNNGDSKTVELVNAVGEVMFHLVISSTEMKVDASLLPKGIYFATVIDERNNTVTKKIVKM